MWQQDPFKAKWTIIARGYSSIRDHVGKINAPLDAFLKLVCPVIGIIRIEDYLEKMSWSIEITPDSHISLQQVYPPKIEAFEPYLMNTSMTERDVINFVASQGYITRQAANTITGSRPMRVTRASRQRLHPQEGLLACRPVLPKPTPVIQFCAAATTVEQVPCQWTGIMSDLYNPYAGDLDLQDLTNGASTWNELNFGELLSYDEWFADTMQDGSTAP